MIEVAVVEGIAKVARDDWNALVSDDDSPFVDWDWLHAMEASKSATRNTGWAPYHLVIRDSGRKIVAACPLYLKTHSMGEFVFDHGWAEAAQRANLKYYPKLLVGVPFTPHTGRRFLTAPGVDRPQMIAALGRALMNVCTENKLSSAHVTFCDEDEVAPLAELGFLERLGYQYHWHNAGFQTFDDYLARLKHKRRTAVRHERGALAQQGIEVKVLAGEEIPDSLFAPMYRIYLSTIEKLYWGRQYLTPEFFELMRTDFKRNVAFELAYRGRRTGRGEFLPGKSRRPLWPLLGMLRGFPLPALQRLLLRRNRALHRARTEAFRARRGRRIQMAARLRSGANPQHAFPRASWLRESGGRFSEA